jgi:hypothetical protein
MCNNVVFIQLNDLQYTILIFIVRTTSNLYGMGHIQSTRISKYVTLVASDYEELLWGTLYQVTLVQYFVSGNSISSEH